MRTVVTILVIFAVVAGAIALYLYATTPGGGTPLRFPLTSAQRGLLLRVPASADAFALIPAAAVLHRKLLANPVTQDAVEQWTATQQVPSLWLIGGADVVAWRSGKTTSFAIRMDMVRAFLVRVWMMSSGNVPARWDGTTFVINASSSRAIDAATLDSILALTAGLPEGDMLVVQRDRARGAFPPIARPAVSSVRVLPNEIVLISRARQAPSPGLQPPSPAGAGEGIRARFPRGALLAATFAEPPRLLGDLQRLTGMNPGALVAGGGAIVIYDIDTGTLLPRPKGAIVVPANDASRAAMQNLMRVAEVVGETRDTGRELIVAFDRNSLPTYINDAIVPGTWPANRWSARVDSVRIAPILERLGDSTGLRIAAPRLHRAARDLRRWTAALERAESIEAAASAAGGIEELRVRIASK